MLFTADGTRAKCNEVVWNGVCAGAVVEIEGRGGRPVAHHHAMRRNLMDKFKKQMMDRSEGTGVESFLNLHFPNDVPENLAYSRVVALKKLMAKEKKIALGEMDVEGNYVTKTDEIDPNMNLGKLMPSWMTHSSVTGKKTSKARRDEAERKRKHVEIEAEKARQDAEAAGAEEERRPLQASEPRV